MKRSHISAQCSVFLIAVFLSLTAAACKKEANAIENNPSVLFKPEKKIKHTWYYLSSEGAQQIDLPQHAPKAALEPWTESVRISAAGSTVGDKNSVPASYALVNRAGMLVFKGDTFEFYGDKTLFKNTSTGPLVFKDNSPIFTLYKSAFFNEETQAAKDSSDKSAAARPFLVQFRTDTNVFYPIISYGNMKLSDNTEVTGYTWDGQTLLCSIKQIKPERIVFSYVGILPPKSLLSDASYTDISPDSYRKAQEPRSFDKAPSELVRMLSRIPHDVKFSVDCTDSRGTSAVRYLHGTSSMDDIQITAKAYIADTWLCTVFNDGTVYLEGSLFNRPVLKDGEPVSFRLPRLPAGYIYGDFAISGSALYVSWEETSFFSTGRSGFIQVDMDKLLYR